jgi:hypothetical protein
MFMRVEKSFENELGNTITVAAEQDGVAVELSIRGPLSESTNRLTTLEAMTVVEVLSRLFYRKPSTDGEQAR